MRNLKCLSDRVVELSEQFDFHKQARNEWIPFRSEAVRKRTRGQNTHYLVNFINGNKIEINEDYISLFIPKLNLSTVKESFRQICHDLRKIPHPALAIYTFLNEDISRKEFDFLIDMSRKTYDSLTIKQEIYIRQTNIKLIAAINESSLGRVDWEMYGVPSEVVNSKQ